MNLILSSGETIANPTSKQIREAVSGLDIDRDGEGFAILERDDMSYCQASGDKKGGFDLEYQEGSIKQHFRVHRQDLSLDEVVQIFDDYRDNKVNWEKVGEWTRIDV